MSEMSKVMKSWPSSSWYITSAGASKAPAATQNVTEILGGQK